MIDNNSMTDEDAAYRRESGRRAVANLAFGLVAWAIAVAFVTVLAAVC